MREWASMICCKQIPVVVSNPAIHRSYNTFSSCLCLQLSIFYCFILIFSFFHYSPFAEEIECELTNRILHLQFAPADAGALWNDHWLSLPQSRIYHWFLSGLWLWNLPVNSSPRNDTSASSFHSLSRRASGRERVQNEVTAVSFLELCIKF